MRTSKKAKAAEDRARRAAEQQRQTAGEAFRRAQQSYNERTRSAFDSIFDHIFTAEDVRRFREKAERDQENMWREQARANAQSKRPEYKAGKTYTEQQKAAINKARALKASRDHATTPQGEKDNAARLLHRILSKHSLTEADLW